MLSDINDRLRRAKEGLRMKQKLDAMLSQVQETLEDVQRKIMP